jgi:hypothetical protein
MEKHKANSINELDVVALLTDAPEHNLNDDTVLVEFCDNDGATYAITPLSKKLLLTLVYETRAA